MEFLKCEHCGYQFIAEPFVRFNKNVALDKARETNQFLPKFETKVGVDCPKCGRFQKWMVQDEQMMLNSRFYIGQPKVDAFGFSTHTEEDACMLQVRVKTNCPMGGDAGHGGVTTLQLIDHGSTCMEVNGREADRVEIVLKGDAEFRVLVECLKFAVKALEEQYKRN